MNRVTLSVLASAALVLTPLTGSPSSGQGTTSLSQKEFTKSDMAISTAVVRLDEVMVQVPNAGAWSIFIANQTSRVAVHIDPRSGTPASMVTSKPLIPGTGKGNTVTLADLESALGVPVPEVTASVVGGMVKQWVVANRDVFAISVEQLGSPAAAQVTDYLWQVSIPQVAGGIPVRDSRLLGTLNHGNLVAIGTERWGNVSIDTRPSVGSDEAMRVGFQYAGGRQAGDVLWRDASLEVIPIAPPGRETAYPSGGPVGGGYGHRLAWVFGFERTGEFGRWEVLVDAQTAEVVAFADRNQYLKRKIGGVPVPVENENGVSSR